jgi:hypothetical protein
LNEALQILMTEPNQSVRQHGWMCIPFIPVNYADASRLLQICRTRSTYEASYVVHLFRRTVARYPNHPVVQDWFDLVEQATKKIARNESDPSDLQILNSLKRESLKWISQRDTCSS